MIRLVVFCKDLQFELSRSYSDTHPSKLVFRRSLRCLGEWKLGSSLDVVQLDVV